MQTIVTGSAGFIGFHLCKKLIESGENVTGIDNLNSYYDVNLKLSRLKELNNLSKKSDNNFDFIKSDLEDTKEINDIFKEKKPKKVVNLAAQAGVRYSIENPSAYIQSNLVGFGNILEACRHNEVEHLLYASSSSVYGGNVKMPFKEQDSVNHPISLYAASKKANELMAHTYSHLYNLPTTGLRFFTVYGPWGRPDMALFLFTKAILENKPIKIFNNGHMTRDFTYIDDIVESMFRLLNKKPSSNINFKKDNPDPASSWAPYKVFNIGNSNPIALMDYIKAIESSLGIEAKKEYLPIQPGDVPSTSADTSLLEEWIGFKPSTSVKKGVNKFVEWYKDYYKI